MITCSELNELLFDFASSQLSAEHRDHVEQHLRLCSFCVAYMESYCLTIQMARQLPRTPLPPHLAQQLQVFLEESRRSQIAEDQERTLSSDQNPQ